MSIKLLRQFIREIRMTEDPNPDPSSLLKHGDAIRPTVGQGVLFDDEEEDTQEERGAACVLIVNDDGKVLAVSRRDDPNDFGLPGGKVDPGETVVSAARRELEEETGLSVGELTLVFAEHDGNMICRTFMGKAAGKIDTDESGVIRWVDPSVLLQGSFGGYNSRLFKKIGLM